MYVMYAVISMTPPRAIPPAASSPELHLKIFRKIGSALCAAQAKKFLKKYNFGFSFIINF